MNVLLIGPPGSGKGTQGERLSRRLGLTHLAAGDMLREEVAAGTELGNEAAELMRRGDLVPDELVLGLVLPRIIAAARNGGYVLDGFPRSVAQANEARHLADDASVAPVAAIYLDATRDVLMSRILARAEVEGRSDDNEETVRNRLRVFDDATAPLIEHYRERGLLRVVDADQDPDAVTDAIVAELG